MSRTYRHTKGNRKVFTGISVSFLDCSYHGEGRGLKKLKNGAKSNDQEQQISLMYGHYGFGVPKAFRKTLVRMQRAKQRNELRTAFLKDDFDKVGEVIDKKNAGWLYY